MTIWAWAAIFFGFRHATAIALIDTVFVIVFAGILLARDKRKERKNREQGERGRT